MSNIITRTAVLLALAVTAGGARAAEWRGLLDVRAVDSDAAATITESGMAKSRYSSDAPRFSIGQAVLHGDMDLTETVGASVELSADQQHLGRAVDVREAFLSWNPLPSGAWKNRVKAGFFFPPSSVELDYDAVGWVPKHTISAAAINSWIGEEVRTYGVEWSAKRLGRYTGAPYDVGVLAAVFTGNDPTGTLLAWRGWSITDRIGGRNAAFELPDIPSYGDGGTIWRQSRTIHPYRELDGRLGYYLGANANWGSTLELAALHYDNQTDATVIKGDQWGWRTRFNHISAVWRPQGEWELAMQAMRGDTVMGRSLVGLGFQSWYLLASHPLGPGTAALRYDRFRTSEHDRIPSDPNGETGYAVALAYDWPLADSLSLMTEALLVRSDRPARRLIAQQTLQNERSLTASLRWRF